MYTLKKIFTKIAKLSVPYKIGGGVLAVVLVVTATYVFSESAAPSETTSETTHVGISSVASLSDNTAPLPVTGKVTSISKADILAVSSGEIVNLSRSLGDRVGAGSIIATFENSSQRAAVLQAQGAYEGAQAALAKASGSTAQNSGVSSAQAAQSAQNAATAANTALRSAYAALDDAVHTKADTLFSNPKSANPQLNFSVSNSQLVLNIQNKRITLDALIDGVNTTSNNSSGDIDARITEVISKAQTVEGFLNDLVEAINTAIPTPNTPASTIATYQASISAARTAVQNSIASLTTAKGAYNSAVSGATVAANSASAGTTNDIASAQANVKSALGSLNAAQANLEKTIIRAPISGTIVSLPITRGGYVAAFTPVAQISNPGALEVETYVTSDDAKTLVVGGKAKIDDTTEGVVVFIAPALDPTIGKIQVKIGLPDGQSLLTDGDTVAISLERSTAVGGKKTTKTTITIPIAAAKITPSGPVVFTVSSSTLVSNPVTFGAILGGQVTILKGLTLDMEIVTDARGLSAGQQVVIDSNK